MSQKRKIYYFSMLIVLLVSYVGILSVVTGLLHVFETRFLWTFTVSCVLLLDYYGLSSFFYFRTLNKSADSLTRYYLVHMLLRFVVCGAIALAGSAFLDENVKVYLLSFCTYFIVTLTCESFIFVYFEKQLNGTQSKK